jgi:hypothetical protein
MEKIKVAGVPGIFSMESHDSGTGIATRGCRAACGGLSLPGGLPTPVAD